MRGCESPYLAAAAAQNGDDRAHSVIASGGWAAFGRVSGAAADASLHAKRLAYYVRAWEREMEGGCVSLGRLGSDGELGAGWFSWRSGDGMEVGLSLEWRAMRRPSRMSMH